MDDVSEGTSGEEGRSDGVGNQGVGCPSCGGTSVVRDYQHSILICADCGMVLKEAIKDRGPEWRSFSQEQREEKSRAGPPTTETIHDRGLSTFIDRRNRDSRGRSIPSKRRPQVYRLRKWQRRSRVSGAKDRNLALALGEMHRMSSRLGLPRSAQEIASKVYRRAVDEGLVRGRSIEGVISAVLYAACREAQVPRTLEEVAEVSRVDGGEIGRDYRFISRRLDIHLPPTDPARYVARFGSELGLSGEIRTAAAVLIKRAQGAKLTSGKSPAGTAAACIYMATITGGERRTQREIAEVAGVTEVTVRNRYKEIAGELGQELVVEGRAGSQGSSEG